MTHPGARERASTQRPWTSVPRPWDGDAMHLARELRAAIAGDVGFDGKHRALYATDASNYRQPPIGVVMPRTAEDVVAAVAICRRHGAPVLGRGGGTSLAGQCCNQGVVFDCSRHMHRIVELDAATRTARVEPGVVLDHLRHRARQQGLTFGPDPSTHDRCTLGGMIGNNSCGVHALWAGRTVDNVHELDVLTYDGLRLRVGATSPAEQERIVREGGRRGEIWAALAALRDRTAALVRARFPRIPRRVSGYCLDELLPENGCHVGRSLVGSEGTCVMLLEATVRLLPYPRHRRLVVVGYDDVFHAADDVPRILELAPIGLEAIDHLLLQWQEQKAMHPDDLAMLPRGKAWLLVEFGSPDADEPRAKVELLRRVLRGAEHVVDVAEYDREEEEQKVWAVREAGLGATARLPNQEDAWPGWEDSAVHPRDLGAYLRDLKALFREYGYEASVYGHFGDGCVHCRIPFELRTAAGIDTYRRFVDAAADLVVRYGGSLSGEHGDGQARAELLPKMYGPELCEAFREFKAIWDPQGGMNPGKVVAPYPITTNLRLGTDYQPWQPQTVFRYAKDAGSLARASLRCVGVGLCRREHGGTMCPSYRVTHQEQHSTRGRAHLLFEMMQGDVIADGWRSEAVKEALDLCLACKGCKGECPVDVDMATYKAEFLHHHYRGRLRPRAAYAMGLIWWWARLASHAPHLANAIVRAPGLGKLVKWLGGVAPERQVPAFAPETFRDWYHRRSRRRADDDGRALGARHGRVLLWPDTFTNFWQPRVGRAAVEVLEHLGFAVAIPPRILCCGRPLYDYGFLGRARKLLRQILEVVRDDVRAGVPVIGLEPSCVATFRDELPNLFPNDQDAMRLSRQTFLLSEFLEQHVPKSALPRLPRRALVHLHCHHRAVLKDRAERNLLRDLGLDAEVLDSGCCGMAGSFGYERGEKYEVSVACGERVLLPRVRSADHGTLILADGFSCREQIRQQTERQALHVAEVMAMAIAGGSSPRAAAVPATAPVGAAHVRPQQGPQHEAPQPIERAWLADDGRER